MLRQRHNPSGISSDRSPGLEDRLRFSWIVSEPLLRQMPRRQGIWRLSWYTRLSSAMEPPVLLDLSAVPFDTLDGTLLLELEGTPSRAIRNGLPAHAFDALQSALGLPAAALAEALKMAPRTLSRRRASGVLAPDESDRLLRVARLAEMATAALGDSEAAAAWMTHPHALLEGETPLQRADTAPGAREIEDMLYAIEFTSAA